MNRKKGLILGLAGSLVAPGAVSAAAKAESDNSKLWQVIEEQQKRIDRLEGQNKGASTDTSERRFHFGGYGSVRGEVNNLDAEQSGFTFRRFVLTGEGAVNDRLKTYFELEFERFGALELSKSNAVDANRFSAAQAVEGTRGSEISMEQAWARYTVNSAVDLDFGAMLVPLGRFNINHDDNQWNLTRRPLVDRGIPVLPSKAAWPELGLGISGNFGTAAGLLDYKFYVVNGVNLDYEFEGYTVNERQGSTTIGVNRSEAKFAPGRGGFANDLNGNKAVTGRLALQPAIGQEVAVSGYYGRYTPSYMDSESVWSLALDGLNKLGGFELEYEIVHTDWGNIDRVAESFARVAIDKEVEAKVAVSPSQTKEIVNEITLGGLAESRTGYWVEVRYPFWTEALDKTFLGRGFASPKLEPTLRLEQVVSRGSLTGISFSNRQLTGLSKEESSTVSRTTLGIAYRPVPEWAISLATEYTWTDERSLSGQTNYMQAGPNENSALSFTTGVAYAF